ncbi:hypothetical protein BJ170DRAFT_695699, partial [Xylariales sp. AK1849]
MFAGGDEESFTPAQLQAKAEFLEAYFSSPSEGLNVEQLTRLLEPLDKVFFLGALTQGPVRRATVTVPDYEPFSWRHLVWREQRWFVADCTWHWDQYEQPGTLRKFKDLAGRLWGLDIPKHAQSGSGEEEQLGCVQEPAIDRMQLNLPRRCYGRISTRRQQLEALVHEMCHAMLDLHWRRCPNEDGDDKILGVGRHGVPFVRVALLVRHVIQQWHPDLEELGCWEDVSGPLGLVTPPPGLKTTAIKATLAALRCGYRSCQKTKRFYEKNILKKKQPEESPFLLRWYKLTWYLYSISVV